MFLVVVLTVLTDDDGLSAVRVCVAENYLLDGVVAKEHLRYPDVFDALDCRYR